jgi:F0F1-type ATP synthase delta subunit
MTPSTPNCACKIQKNVIGTQIIKTNDKKIGLTLNSKYKTKEPR